MKTLRFAGLACLLLLVALTGCKFKLGDDPNWDTQMLVPLVSSRVTIQDALQDTTFIKENGDGTLTLVYRDTVVNFNLADYVVVPDTSVRATVTLDSIKLRPDTLDQIITLGQIARGLISSGTPTNVATGNFILSSHGTYQPVLTTRGLSTALSLIDASALFETATLINGYIDLQIFNGLPVILDSLMPLLKNATLGDSIVYDTLPSISPGATQSTTKSLAGKTIESDLLGGLSRFDIVGFGPFVPVLIDTNDFVRIRIIVRGLKASSATAVFPSQTVINDRNNVVYTFGDGVEITRLKVRSGTLDVTATSTINDTLEFIYSLPTAIKDNNAVVSVTRLNPAPLGGSITQTQSFDLTDHYIDLTVDGDSVNRFPQHLVGNLIYSGNLVSMDLADSIYVKYGLNEIKPSYIEGYIGKDTLSFRDTVTIDVFKSIQAGTLDLKDPKVSIVFDNSIGVDGLVKINAIRAANTRSGATLNLSGSVLTTPVNIVGPKMPNVGESVSTRIYLDQYNSNIRAILAIIPDRFEFDFEVFANYNGIPSLHNNFAAENSAITAMMDIESLLEGVASNLLLQDTIDFDLTSMNINTEKLKNSVLKFKLDNSFPMDASVQMYFHDASNTRIDSLFNGMKTIAGAPIGGDGMTHSKVTTYLDAPFDAARLERLKNAKYVIAKFKLNTIPGSVPVKIYSTYGIDFKLVGDFQYMVGK